MAFREGELLRNVQGEGEITIRVTAPAPVYVYVVLSVITVAEELVSAVLWVRTAIRNRSVGIDLGLYDFKELGIRAGVAV